ncbi:hypothetical protein [Formosa algae]|uniref:Uncharacterized protein n=1 Tax=Formosa algae TaxID=225843 RepID=A0A9X0YLR7_9FLAO|nr:hypothetical protein [Formosa algae]MBP1840926.1 hypothetical protein [Formosa algae]MDQ0336177.1 hypothetical protein [Formosa algae]OEI79953.1 hypothetical protein AST99_11760 [Formosa algae]
MHVHYLNISRQDMPNDSSRELNYWIRHLKTIQKELKHLYSETKAAKHTLIKKTISTQVSLTQSILNALLTYKEFRDWMHDDDLQNDNAFIFEHKKHKDNYLQHVKRYCMFRSKLLAH